MMLSCRSVVKGWTTDSTMEFCRTDFFVRFASLNGSIFSRKSSVDSGRYSQIPRTYSYVSMIEDIPRTYSYVRVIEPRRLVSIRVSAFLSALTDTPSAENKLRARALARARPVQIHPIFPLEI